MKTRKALLADLPAVGARYSGNETYGKQSMIYIAWPSLEQRKEGERKLKALGHKIHPRYWPEAPRSEIQVRYFHGHHWDE